MSTRFFDYGGGLLYHGDTLESAFCPFVLNYRGVFNIGATCMTNLQIKLLTNYIKLVIEL